MAGDRGENTLDAKDRKVDVLMVPENRFDIQHGCCVYHLTGDQAQAVWRTVHVLLALHGLEQSVGQMGGGVRPHGRGTRSFGNAEAAQGEAEKGEGLYTQQLLLRMGPTSAVPGRVFLKAGYIIPGR